MLEATSKSSDSNRGQHGQGHHQNFATHRKIAINSIFELPPRLPTFYSRRTNLPRRLFAARRSKQNRSRLPRSRRAGRFPQPPQLGPGNRIEKPRPRNRQGIRVVATEVDVEVRSSSSGKRKTEPDLVAIKKPAFTSINTGRVEHLTTYGAI